MNVIQSLFSNCTQQLKAYTPIEPPSQIASRLGIPEKEILKLDANESPFDLPEPVRERIVCTKDYAIYPDPAQVNLKRAIAGHIGCSPENIVVGAGADELIDLTCRLFLESGEKVIGFEPTFSYYRHVISLNRGRYLSFERDPDFSISLDSVVSKDLKGVKLVFLCSPNNPTGNLLETSVLDYFLHKDLIVLLDEAYIEFAGESLWEKIQSFNNLIVLRTFSKCFGLAGLRVGYGIMSAPLAEGMARIKPPYSVNAAAEQGVIACLEHLEIFQSQVKEVISTREWLMAELAKIPQVQATPSHGCFVLCRLNGCDAKKVKLALAEQGVLVRYFDTSLLNNYIRISIGTLEQMKRFLEVFKKQLDNI